MATYEKYRKCGTTVTVCPSCNNELGTSILGDKLTCSKCHSTGGLCKQHGAHWR